MSQIEGKIAAILSPAKVVINKGSKDGIEVGDYFYIYSELGPFTDPDTNQKLESTKQIWGRVEVSLVENRFCIAETGTRLINPVFSASLAALFGTTRVKIKLPVEEGQIWKSLERIEVGCPALLVKRSEESDQLQEDNEMEELPPVQPPLLVPATYRRTEGHDTWHFCSNCSNWPTTDFETRSDTPTSGELCNECRAKKAVNKCY
jgi:hypothetical protein